MQWLRRLAASELQNVVAYLKTLAAEGLLLESWFKRAISSFVVVLPLDQREEDITAIAAATDRARSLAAATV